MALPLLFLIPAAASGLYGLYKGAQAISDHSDASDLNDTAQYLVNCSRRKVDEQREQTSKVIEDYGARKLRAFNGVIAEFIENFGKLKNVEIVSSPELDKLQLGDAAIPSITGLRNDWQALQDMGLGLGAGLGSGAALAFGSYSGTMLLATASTGTAISSLSGAAATNATLAWLGGGSIAAGGGGIAMGTAVLGGIIAGPALAIFGHIVGNKAEAALADAHSNMENARSFAKEADLIQEQLAAIQKVTSLANGVFSKISSHLRRSVHALNSVIENDGVNYNTYTPENREVVLRAVKFAQLTKAMIDTPILDEDGKLVLSTEKRVSDIQKATKKIAAMPA